MRENEIKRSEKESVKIMQRPHRIYGQRILNKNGNERRILHKKNNVKTLMDLTSCTLEDLEKSFVRLENC